MSNTYARKLTFENEKKSLFFDSEKGKGLKCWFFIEDMNNIEKVNE